VNTWNPSLFPSVPNCKNQPAADQQVIEIAGGWWTRQGSNRRPPTCNAGEGIKSESLFRPRLTRRIRRNDTLRCGLRLRGQNHCPPAPTAAPAAMALSCWSEASESLCDHPGERTEPADGHDLLSELFTRDGNVLRTAILALTKSIKSVELSRFIGNQLPL